MTRAECRAFAKINLALDVLGVREDGYHRVRMIMQEISLSDTVEIEKREEPGFCLLCDEPGIPTDGKNLAVRAASDMFRAYGLMGGLTIRLKKRIPAAAGLAGGSSDAAAVIRLVNVLYRLELSEQKLRETGLKIGADVPYCIQGGTALSEGIGEILSPLSPCPDCGILLCKPEEGASTAEIYRAFDALENPCHPPVDEGIRALIAGDFAALSRAAGNSLEAVTKKKIPLIGEIEEEMLRSGASASCMSGSGPTVFGLFPDLRAAEAAEKALKKAFPSCFTAAVRPVNARDERRVTLF